MWPNILENHCRYHPQSMIVQFKFLLLRFAWLHGDTSLHQATKNCWCFFLQPVPNEITCNINYTPKFTLHNAFNQHTEYLRNPEKTRSKAENEHMTWTLDSMNTTCATSQAPLAMNWTPFSFSVQSSNVEVFTHRDPTRYPQCLKPVQSAS